MKTVFCGAGLIVSAFVLNGQIASTINRLPNGSEEVTIRNDSTSPVVAFAVTVRQVPQSAASSDAPVVVYSDPLIEPSDKLLPPGEERLVLARGVRPRQPRAPHVSSPGAHILAEPVVTAAIYGDGSTIGDPALLTRLMSRRTSMLLAVDTAIDTLMAAGRRNVSREELIREFRKMASSLWRWYLSPEQQVGRGLYQIMAGKLVSLPEGEPGTPFPPSAFVAQETALLNQQRVRLLESQPSLLDATLISAR